MQGQLACLKVYFCLCLSKGGRNGRCDVVGLIFSYWEETRTMLSSKNQKEFSLWVLLCSRLHVRTIAIQPASCS